MLSTTILLVSSVTRKGFACQHQSPSRKTLCSSFCCSTRQVVLLPTPIVPPIT